MRGLVLILGAVVAAGCGGKLVGIAHPDAGGTIKPDSGPAIVDAGHEPFDAGHQPVDAGETLDAGHEPVDAGHEVDAGPEPVDAGEAFDAGPQYKKDAGEELDAGPPDAGSELDAGLFDAGPVVCEDASSSTLNIYAPVQVPISLPQDKGRILACLHLGTTTAAELTADPNVTALGWTATNGYEQYIIQYASESPPGSVRRVTAIVDVPQGDVTNVVLASVNHGTSGMGPSCGPSQNATAAAEVDAIAAPMLAKGYAVVSTDYAGMGVNDGISPYTEGHGEALSVLDAIRAMWTFHAPLFDHSQLSGQVFLMGHSQGGQAALFAQEDWDDTVGGTLVGSVTFAPAVGDMQLYHYLLGTAEAPTVEAGVLMAMSLYGNSTYFELDAGSYFTASSVQALPPLFHDECLDDLLNDVPAQEATIGNMFTPEFIAAAGGCALDGGPCPNFEPWNTDLLGDEPGHFRSAAPALIMQGGADIVVAANFTSCIAARMQAEGTPYLACLYTTAQHPTIVGKSIADAYGIMQTLQSGGSLPPFCPQFVPLPSICSPY